MSSTDLNPLSYVVLALIGRRGAGPHDLVEMIRRGGRLYWSASPSKMYAEPKRLEQLGLVRSRREPGKTRERRYYELTDAGVDALRAWLMRPSRFPRIYNEAVCRVLAGDVLGDDETLREGLVTLRRDLAQLHGNLDEAARIAASLPHRERYLSLVHSLGRRLVEAHEAWLDEVERDLGQPQRRTSSSLPGARNAEDPGAAGAARGASV